MPWWCYIVRCADGTLYTGMTNDPDRRVAAHNAGVAAKYTRARRPVELMHIEPCASRSSAASREAAIKRLPREAKLLLGNAAPTLGKRRKIT